MTESPTLVWFRQDLRVEDNPALTAAAERGAPVVPVYIFAPDGEGAWAPGGASRWWLRQSLASLSKTLKKLGAPLVVRKGDSLDELAQLAGETGAGAVYWNRRYEPASLRRGEAVKSALKAKGLEARSFNSSLIFEPWEILNKQGQPYKVFTPYWKAFLTKGEPPPPLPAPAELAGMKKPPSSLPLDDLQLEPTVDWAGGLREAWTPGEAGARERLEAFRGGPAHSYQTERDRPDLVGTSRLSPHLHFGEIGPRQAWRELLKHHARRNEESKQSVWAYLRELGWREFAHHILFHFPHTAEAPLRPEFGDFPWVDDPQALKRWQRGQTGYPIVDAGMRELWTTGWMHNRVRMVAASFLVKDLLISWSEGAKWFWDTLVDADLANNTLGWQWAGGCGADAAPYFRIFNPVTQGEKFDPDGAYARAWIPELANLPAKWIHKPWEAPDEVLRRAGVKLGETYPMPMVDHKMARDRALQAFQRIKKG